MKTLFSIPEALLVPGTNDNPNPDVTKIENLAFGLKIFWGSTLTLVLVAVFVPPSAILRNRSLALAKQENPDAIPSQIESWMKDRGLIEPWSTQLTKVLAMLSPLLSGPVADVMAKLADMDF